MLALINGKCRIFAAVLEEMYEDEKRVNKERAGFRGTNV